MPSLSKVMNSMISMGSSPLCAVVYVLSQIPCIKEHLQNIAPPKMVIRSIKLPDVFDRNLDLNAEQIECIKDAEVVLCDGILLAKCFHHMPNLKWAHCPWAGVESVVLAVKTKEMSPSFQLTRHGGTAFSSLMAEYVICQVLNWERKMKLCWTNQEAGAWVRMERFETFRSLAELTVGVLGVGNMGSGIAQILKPRGTTLLGLARSSAISRSVENRLFDRISTDLGEILPNCDYICNTLPSTPETCGLLNGCVLKMCTKKPVFINVGRGSIIQEESLIQALRNGWIAGAILDVFEKEPLSESSELWHMPQVVITPHVSAISKPEHVAEEFVLNYKRYIAGDKLQNLVNWSAGY